MASDVNLTPRQCEALLAAYESSDGWLMRGIPGGLLAGGPPGGKAGAGSDDAARRGRPAPRRRGLEGDR